MMASFKQFFGLIVVILIPFMLYQKLQKHEKYTVSRNTLVRRQYPENVDKEITFHHLKHKDHHIYVYKFYLDNRDLKNLNVRAFVVIARKPFFKVSCLLHSKEQVVTVIGKMLPMTNIKNDYVINGVPHHTYLLICSLTIPKFLISGLTATIEFVSLQFDDNLPNNKIEVITPEKPDNNVNDSIAVCLSAQYGSVSDEETPFLVQWVELLNILGISKISWYNASLIVRNNGTFYNAALDYYVRKGLIDITQSYLPYTYDKNAYYKHSHAKTSIAQATEILRPAIVNDCFYRNIHKYWYILHIDKDEIPVPYKHYRTYQDFLHSFINNQPDPRVKNRIINLSSLAVMSGFHYINSPKIKVKTDIPNHFPFLKYIYRQPVETKSHRYAKSFVNPRSCNHVWNHRCLHAGDDAFLYLPEKDIQVHHYRKECYGIEKMRHRGQFCNTEDKRQFKDEVIEQKYGKVLAERTLHVLKEINYL